ncbi:MAG: hypothetical protein EOM02_07585 [Synergistales bacterium]|nr:hypothetical protein [Synergistales bacterium]
MKGETRGKMKSSKSRSGLFLRKLTINNFKSIKKIEMDLGQLNIFVGANGSGKSNILEAIGMLSAAISGEVSYSSLADRGVRLSTADIFKSSFEGEKRVKTIRFESEFDDFIYDVSLEASKKAGNLFYYFAEKLARQGNNIASRSNSGATVNSSAVDKLDSDLSVLLYARINNLMEKDISDSLDGLKKFAIYAPTTPILRGISPDVSQKAPLGLYGGSLAGAFRDLLRSSSKGKELDKFLSLFNWIKGIDVSAPDQRVQSSHVHTGDKVITVTDSFMRKDFNSLYGYDVSEGVLYIIFMLVLLYHRDTPKIYALDNVDSALNPAMIKKFIELTSSLLDDQGKQLFMTTHNPTTLDGIDLFNENHRLFVVERDKKGFTEVHRIKPPEGMTKEEWREKFRGIPLSQIWLSGAFGGFPEI